MKASTYGFLVIFTSGILSEYLTIFAKLISAEPILIIYVCFSTGCLFQHSFQKIMFSLSCLQHTVCLSPHKISSCDLNKRPISECPCKKVSTLLE